MPKNRSSGGRPVGVDGNINVDYQTSGGNAQTPLADDEGATVTRSKAIQDIEVDQDVQASSYSSGTLDVTGGNALRISLEGAGTFSLEVRWTTEAGQDLVTQTATDLDASAVTETIQNLTVKSSYVEIDITDDSGSSNNVTGKIYCIS